MFILFLTSYLSNRYQSVAIENYRSEELKVLHGVPQRSVLGPILFNLFINDILHINSSDLTVLFADDTVASVKDKIF